MGSIGPNEMIFGAIVLVAVVAVIAGAVFIGVKLATRSKKSQ